jgi:hypothetical protein
MATSSTLSKWEELDVAFISTSVATNNIYVTAVNNGGVAITTISKGRGLLNAVASRAIGVYYAVMNVVLI